MDGPGGQKFNVGGVLLDRPFKIRRLGHFGFNVRNFDACLKFYTELLGFALSDPLDFGPRVADEDARRAFDATTGWFMRHGGDHHSFVLFPKPVLDHIGGRSSRPDNTINQITWQVGSLREVAEAENWLRGHDIRIRRSGRDQPGSNWHVYPFDPDEHINELYYGIEQIGWDGRSKPPALHEEEFRDQPGLPQIPEYAEVERARAHGTDLASGYRHESGLEARYDVGGVLLPRPFKAVRVGPVRLFTGDLDAAIGFYRDRLGMTVTEEIAWNGHRCAFLRVNTEHHSLALYPIALRAELGLGEHTTCMSFGVQLGDYAQLRASLGFLGERGVDIVHLPPELSPGIDYSAFAIDPDGHAIQLYYYMEQIGWDGRPRSATERRPGGGDWPEALDPLPDTFAGEPFLGPLG
ncbi:MAG: VOC family protein [Defluviicoccus sp.]|nr:VOC family protein [Defluviicoccus sp.]